MISINLDFNNDNNFIIFTELMRIYLLKINDCDVKIINNGEETNLIKLATEIVLSNEYNTEEKDFFGYSLKEINGNEKGTYIDDTIYVEYIYTNTMGTGDIEELPPQTRVEQSNLYNYLIIISMLVLSVRGYKKVKETL